MIVDLMKEILSDYRDNISLEKMDAILCGSSLQNRILQSLNDAESVTLNGKTFQKKSLSEQKNVFFEEFDEYLKDKIHNGKIRADLISNFKQKLPDCVTVEFFEMSMDRQLYVFEMLMTFVVKPSKFVDPLKTCFTHIVDLYSSIAIYLSLLYKNYEEDVDVLCGIFDSLDEIEGQLSKLLFDMLTRPEERRENLSELTEQIDKLDRDFATCLERYFTQVFMNSSHLFKRVFDAELSKFDLTTILTRFNFASLYDWVLFLVDSDTTPNYHSHDLFKDLEVY